MFATMPPKIGEKPKSLDEVVVHYVVDSTMTAACGLNTRGGRAWQVELTGPVTCQKCCAKVLSLADQPW